MARVKITATEAGFHNVSPVGETIAPNVFLKTAVNLKGQIVNLDGGWESRESAMYDDFGISIIASAPEGEAMLGRQCDITITAIEYYRMVDGEKVVIGILELPQPITVTATFDELETGEYGWRADVGDALADAVAQQSFHFSGSDGDDVFDAHNMHFAIDGINVLNGRGGNDHLVGSLGNDKLLGGTGDDYLYDAAGKNLLRGGTGDDWLELGDGSKGSTAHGGSGDDTLISGKGDDFLFGDGGRDTLYGGRGNDHLYGGKGADILDGGWGEDVLAGGRRSDILTGGEDADTFVFTKAGNGQDIVTDFEDGLDHILINGVDGFDDLTIIQDGANTVISWGNAGSITLLDIDASLIGVDDFQFA